MELQPNFTISVKSFKYLGTDISSNLEDNVQMESYQPIEYLKSSGTVAVVLSIRDNTMPSEAGIKNALMTFSVIGGKLNTTGNIKGTDDKTYSLSVEGLRKYYEDIKHLTEPSLF
jgi:hypothetical protein